MRVARYLIVALLMLAPLCASVVNAPPAVAAAAIVQSGNANNNGGSSPISLSFGSAATAGNLLILICGYNGTSSFTPTSGFSTAIANSGTVSQGIYYKVAAGGESSLTCTYTGAAGGTGSIQIYEVSGLRTLNPLDGTGTASGSSGTGSSGSVTTTYANTFLIASLTSATSGGISGWTSSFTAGQSGQTGGKPSTRTSYASAYRSVTATGSYSTTASTPNDAWRGHIAAFKLPPTPATLSVDIVNGSGTPIASPSATLGAVNRAFTCQTSTGNLATSTQRIRVTNNTGSPAWSLTMAPSAGSSATWTSTSPVYHFDYNDGTGSGCNEGDGDSYAGQLSIVPAPVTITPQSGCVTTGITPLASTTAYSGASSITLASAGASAYYYCYWDFTGINISQKIPASQPSGNYSLPLTVTITAV